MIMPSFLSAAWAPRLLAATCLLASIGLVGWQAWPLRDDFRLPQMPKLPTTTAAVPAGALENLFPAPRADSTVGAASTDGLLLQACLVAGVATQSRALIHLPGSGTLNLKVGDMLHDGLVLESVGADQVTLRQGDSLHTLLLAPPAATGPAT